MAEDKVGRPIKIDGMAYAPTNEQGVVFLFGRLAPRLGFHIERVQTHFPDCMARRYGKLCRIEFEYRASNYERQDHPPRGADVVVCWDNDWENRPQKYKHLEVISLRTHVGAEPRVFAVAADRERWRAIEQNDEITWGVPRAAQVGDLVVMYRRSPASEIRDLWRIVGPFFKDREWGPETWLELVVRLTRPITFTDLKNDPATKSLGIVRKQFQGKTDITYAWPQLFIKIVRLNPKAKAKLREYHEDW
jgi:hypothetical protein